MNRTNKRTTVPGILPILRSMRPAHSSNTRQHNCANKQMDKSQYHSFIRKIKKKNTINSNKWPNAQGLPSLPEPFTPGLGFHLRRRILRVAWLIFCRITSRWWSHIRTWCRGRWGWWICCRKLFKQLHYSTDSSIRPSLGKETEKN